MNPVFDIADFENEQFPVRKLIKMVFLVAMSNRATGVRFEEDESNFRMFYRAEGTYCEMVPPPRHLACRIFNLIRVIAQLDVVKRPGRGYCHIRMGEFFIHMFVEMGRGQFGERVDVSLVFSPAAAEEARNLLADYARTTGEDGITLELVDLD